MIDETKTENLTLHPHERSRRCPLFCKPGVETSMTNKCVLPTSGALLGLLLLAGVPAQAGLAGVQTSAAQATDNSGNNKHHTATGTVSYHQSDSKSDVQITAGIRKAILADKGLSTYAHNVKIVTRSGAVILKGPVKSDDEKQKVAAAAANVVSADKITNQITVKQ